MPKSVMEHTFSEVPRANIPRSTFNRSHGHKTVFDCDWLIPILVDDIIPGDTFNVDCNFVARLASPTILPLMDNLVLDTFFFFVPYRLLWDNWEKFCGAQDDPADSIDFTIPTYGTVNQNLQNGDTQDILCDYLGLPYVASFEAGDASVLPFRAYNLIFNEWFRDQNLQDSLTVNTGNGPDSAGDYALKKRGKRHDYFTSCLPWPQKGSAVESPLTGLANIEGIGRLNGVGHNTTDKTVIETDTGSHVYDNNYGSLTNEIIMEVDSSATPLVYANLATATSGISINDFRLAYQTQRLLERDARSGTRYNETLLAHYGVTIPDYRMQRPEFLGGGSSRINISPVAQTTYQGTQTIEDAKGSLSGIGIVSGSHGFTKSFVEHGLIMGLCNVRGDITYSQGLERYWSKSTRYDFYYPVLSQIGEQAVLNKEIFYQNAAADENVFGYQERYAEYRYKPSRLSHAMRPDHSATLAAFHLSEDFGSLPSLNSAFIEAETEAPLDRALSVPTQPHFVADFYFDMKCARPMPLYGVPGNLDRF